MVTKTPSIAQQVAKAASNFQEKRTGYAPEAVTVVLSNDTLVITLHGALSPAEKALAKTAEGAAQVQEYHRQLFASDSAALREEIKRITGFAVSEVAAEVEPESGVIVQAFTTGTVVQVFSMEGSSPTQTWSGSQSKRKANSP